MRWIGTVFLAALVASCSSSTVPSGMATYEDEETGFRLRYPAGWKRISVGGKAKVMFSGGMNTQVSVSTGLGGEREIAAAIEQFGRSVPRYEELRGGWVKVDGRRAYLQCVSWDSPLGKNKAFRLYVPAGAQHFTVSAMAPAEEFDRLELVLHDCVLRFELIEPGN